MTTREAVRPRELGFARVPVEDELLSELRENPGIGDLVVGRQHDGASISARATS